MWFHPSIGRWQEEIFDSSHGATDRGRWQVHLALESAEKDAVKSLAPGVIPAEHFEIHAELEAGGEAELIFAVRVDADTAEQAIGRALGIFAKIRKAAALPRQDASVLGYIAPSWRGPSQRLIAKEAVDLLCQGRDELAVIRAQTACELLIAAAFETLAAGAPEGVDLTPWGRRPTNLQHESARRLLQQLSGRVVQQASWWSAYKTHLRRRNEIVHAGIAIRHEDAQASIKVMNELNEWMFSVTELAFAATADGGR